MKKNKILKTCSPTPSTVTVIGDVVPNLETSALPEMKKYGYFTTPIYHLSVPRFLPQVQAVADRLLAENTKDVPDLNPIYPVRQTSSILHEPTLDEFLEFVGGTGWNALQSDGYAMNLFSVTFLEGWVQEHHTHSGHDEHVHAYGSQLVGFYFLDVPASSGRLVVHDPRPGKRQINLPEQDINAATYASTAINFEPKAGDLYFAPSWVPHSISRHSGDTPLRLVHITMGVIPNQQVQQTQTEPSTVTII